MQERALPNLPLAERPRLDLTDEEVRALYKFSPVITGKIMKNQVAHIGYEDIADATVKGYRSFILKIFSEEKK